VKCNALVVDAISDRPCSGSTSRRRWGRWSWAPKEGRAALSVGVGLGVLGDLPRRRRSRRSSAYAESAGQNWDRSDGLPLASSEERWGAPGDFLPVPEIV